MPVGIRNSSKEEILAFVNNATSSELCDLSSKMKDCVDELEEKIKLLNDENLRLKNLLDGLLNLTVAVPYESGYLRAIGATRNIKLYEWYQLNLNDDKQGVTR